MDNLKVVGNIALKAIMLYIFCYVFETLHKEFIDIAYVKNPERLFAGLMIIGWIRNEFKEKKKEKENKQVI